MTGRHLRDISDTALWLAYYRAQETGRPHATVRVRMPPPLAGERAAERLLRTATFR